MTKIHVKVTAEHIAKGEPCDSATCPIALALYDVLPPTTAVIVDRAIILIDIDGERAWDFDSEIDAFVGSVDSGDTVYPFEFILDSDDPTCRSVSS